MVSFRPITDWCSHRAIFFNSSGEPVGSKKLKYSEELFEYQGRSYHFLPRKTSFFKFSGLLSSHKFYFYDVSNPMPLNISSNVEPFIDSRVYTAVVDNKLVKDLNDLANVSLLSKLLEPKILIPLLILIGAIYYFTTGGSLV